MRWFWHRLRAVIPGGTGLVLAWALVWAQAAVTSPELHQWMHGEPACCDHSAAGEDTSPDHGAPAEEDGENEEHLCLVTLLGQGVETAPVEGPVEPVRQFVGEGARETLELRVAAALPGPGARAPPVKG